MNLKRLALWITLTAAAVFALLQFVPYGYHKESPPIVSEPHWDSPRTRELAQRACFDCHSNETAWPWYGDIAPAGWLVQRDVTLGRMHLNFSDWSQSHATHGHETHEPEDLAEAVRDGSMPPANYLLLHPAARLTADEKAALMDGLTATALASPVTPAAPADDHGHDE